MYSAWGMDVYEYAGDVEIHLYESNQQSLLNFLSQNLKS